MLTFHPRVTPSNPYTTHHSNKGKWNWEQLDLSTHRTQHTWILLVSSIPSHATTAATTTTPSHVWHELGAEAVHLNHTWPCANSATWNTQQETVLSGDHQQFSFTKYWMLFLKIDFLPGAFFSTRVFLICTFLQRSFPVVYFSSKQFFFKTFL